MRKLMDMILFLVIASTLFSTSLIIPSCHSDGLVVVESPSEPEIIQRADDGVCNDTNCQKKLVTPPSESTDQAKSPNITVIVVEPPSEPKIIQRGVGDGVYDPDDECKKKLVIPPSKSTD